MIKAKRIICIIISVLIVVGLFVGCTTGTGKKDNNDVGKTSSKSNESDNKSTSEDLPTTGFPIVETPITLKIMARYRTGMADFKDMITWQEYEKLTNIKIDWIMIERASAGEKRNLALATGDLPDAFLKCNFSNSDLIKYGAEGTFIPLNDLIDKYAPNYQKAINDEVNFPDAKRAVTRLDSNIYSFIYLIHNDSVAVKVGPNMYINKKWMDAVGKGMPTTTDEFYDVLKAFKTGDPNGNGQADEIPWYVTGVSGLDPLNGAWGLQNRGTRVGYIDFDENLKKVRFYPADPKYKEMLQFANKLYNEKLIDEEMFTANLADLLAKGSKNMIGAFVAAGNQYVGPEHENDFVGLDYALKGPHGDQNWNANPSALTTGSFVITN
ncbi:MAG TPA: extracellular solute-binding protein, partial [Clostridiales bacterium]|nr:extracellular solute-binding protein [Clostridiales bacterium]